MELRIVRLDRGDTYVDKNGKERPNVNYYIVVNDTWVPIRPSFSQGYSTLDLICEKVKK